jgi:hypothetical protein
MGNALQRQKVGFEDIQQIQGKDIAGSIIINTLPEDEQSCLIMHTIDCNNEAQTINQMMNEKSLYTIIIYGKHTVDESVIKKYDQLIKLGFTKVYIYLGGMFEWLLLQDIYSEEEFPTTTKELDILKFKPPTVLNRLLIK